MTNQLRGVIPVWAGMAAVFVATGVALGLPPGTRVSYKADGRVSRVYNAVLATGATPVESAEGFLAANAGMLGVNFADLALGVAGDSVNDGIQELLFDPDTQQYKGTAVYYYHVVSGVPVYDSRVALVVRNEPGYPLVLAVNNLVRMLDFAYVPPDPAVILPAAEEVLPGVTAIGPATEVLWAEPPLEFEPLLAYQFVAQVGDWLTPGYQAERIIVDAHAIPVKVLDHHDLILRSNDITGRVGGFGTPLDSLFPDCCYNPDCCADPSCCGNQPEELNLKNAYLQLNGVPSTKSGSLGEFGLCYADDYPVEVVSLLNGPYASVRNNDDLGSGGVGPPSMLTLTAAGPGTLSAPFVHNADSGSEYLEFLTAQVNVFVHTNIVHDFVIAVHPGFPGINVPLLGIANYDAQNLTARCQAYYFPIDALGPAIAFYRSGPDPGAPNNVCPNEAYSTVVYHEWWHYGQEQAGVNQAKFPAYREGMSDCMAILVTDDPHFGEDFEGAGIGPARNAINDLMYPWPPCLGSPHECGRILSGAIWDTRTALRETEPISYRKIISNLTINSVLVQPDGLTPDLLIDFLSLDAVGYGFGEGPLCVAAPHFAEIRQGFTNHGLSAGAECGDVNFSGGQPDLDDILCVLACFSLLASCPCADIAPCMGDGGCDLDDILSVIGAFGDAPCCGA